MKLTHFGHLLHLRMVKHSSLCWAECSKRLFFSLTHTVLSLVAVGPNTCLTSSLVSFNFGGSEGFFFSPKMNIYRAKPESKIEVGN